MKKLFLLLTCLLLSFSLASCSKSTELTQVSDYEPAKFTLTVNDTTVTSDMLKDLKVYKCHYRSENSEGTTKEYDYIGYKLTDVLNVIGVKDTVKKVYAKCDDDVEINVDGKDILKDALIAFYRIDDKGEKQLKVPTFAPINDPTTGDFAKNVVIININK